MRREPIGESVPENEVSNSEPQKAGPPPRGSPRPTALRPRDQAWLAAAAALALASTALYCLRSSSWGTYPIELQEQPNQRLEYKIDLNSATWVEWEQLPGVGPKLARGIVEERDQNGPFRSVDDLKRVRGIGKQKIEAIRPFVRTAEPAVPAEPWQDIERTEAP